MILIVIKQDINKKTLFLNIAHGDNVLFRVRGQVQQIKRPTGGIATVYSLVGMIMKSVLLPESSGALQSRFEKKWEFPT